AVADRDPPAAVGLTARPRAAEPGETIDSPHKAQTHGRKAERMTSSTPAATADIGVIGLAVMGSNLARNLARNGYTVALYNRTHARTTALVSAHGGEGTFVPAESLAEFVAALERPRRVLIMVQAGAATDAVIDEVAALIGEGDIVIDGGTAQFTNTYVQSLLLSAHGQPSIC